MDGHDVRVVQRRGRARLNLETTTVIGLDTEHRVQKLDRDRAAQPGIPTVANLGHAAATQDTSQFVAAAQNLRGLHNPTLAPGTTRGPTAMDPRRRPKGCQPKRYWATS